jgi:hypothetical protein
MKYFYLFFNVVILCYFYIAPSYELFRGGEHCHLGVNLHPFIYP